MTWKEKWKASNEARIHELMDLLNVTREELWAIFGKEVIA